MSDFFLLGVLYRHLLRKCGGEPVGIVMGWGCTDVNRGYDDDGRNTF